MATGDGGDGDDADSGRTDDDEDTVTPATSNTTPSVSFDRLLPPRSRLAWWLLTLVVVGILLWLLLTYLGIIAFGLFLYYVGRPAARRLEATVGTTARAAILTILLGIIPLVVFLLSLVAIAIGQALTLTDADVDQALETLAPGLGLVLDRPPESPADLASMLADQLRPADATVLLEYGTGVLAQLATLVFTVTLLFAFVYLLLCYDRVIAGWLRSLGNHRDAAGLQYFRGVDRELSRVYAGQMLTVIAVVVLAWVLFRALNLVAPAPVEVPVPILLAIVIGIASFIPLVGRSLVYIPLVAYLAIRALQTDPQSLWVPAAVAVLGWVVIDPIIRYWLRPSLSSHGTPSSVMLVGYLVGGATVGWYGVFLAPLVVVAVRRFLTVIFPALVRGVALSEAIDPSVGERKDETSNR
ncbi:permease [Natrialba chahannaoensis JCM 10990]|uniref:Permease n=1 Tax=Natrialba chahannaoensis JCM 10990 TaxID=1227492 RepID=M0AF83_9EURY|nr:AI-2E family transporter [Natrialba chahannaoensis]ELY96512.1 permease [Natrialba chahannaoensis JCM 10990]